MGTSDRRPYLSATGLTQALLDECQDNLAGRLEMIANIYNVGTALATLRLSDRAKYVGDTYYEARVKFPLIERTIGDWLSGQIEFSTLTLQVNNSDKMFNSVLPGGDLYNGLIGRRVEVLVGLGEIASSYRIIFAGEVTNVSGFSRDVSSFTVVCRSDFDKLNVQIPNQLLVEEDWPNLEPEFVGLGGPIIYGDWTTDLRAEGPEVPAFPVNGLDPLVNGSLEPPDPGAGNTPLRCIISSTPISYLDTSSVTLFRGSKYYTFAAGDIAVVGGSSNQVFDITQKNLLIDGNPWVYASGDEFFVKCRGVDLLTYSANIVAQAQDILKRFGGLVTSDFDSSWSNLSAKNSPAQSAIASITSRVWIQESQSCLEYVLSMLEQVRLEVYVNRSNKFALSSLHFEDLVASPSYSIRNWDVVRDSFVPNTDDKNNFNRARADFRFSPPKNQNALSSAYYRNQAAITQAGRAIGKLIVFPNIVQVDDVVAQLGEMLKLASCYFEIIEVKLTSRSFLKDISDDVILDVDIGSVSFQNTTEPVTGRIRKIGYDPVGLSIPVSIWSFQMVPFPGSEKVGISGITGGSTAVITKET